MQRNHRKIWLRGIHPYPSATTPKEDKSEQGNSISGDNKCTIAQQAEHNILLHYRSVKRRASGATR